MESKTTTMSTDELTCQELVEVITAYLEEAMPPSERARFEEHLAACRHCRAYLEQMRHTLRALGTLTEESISSPARQRLLRAFRDWKRG